MDLKALADSNLTALKDNRYPGRLIIAGLNDSGQFLIQVYALMGRSPKSRNRVLVQSTDVRGLVKVEVADPSKLDANEDLSLIVYTAMAENPVLDSFVVSNGEHTGVALLEGVGNITESYSYEPDSPNFTPRIAAGFDLISDDPADEYNRIARMALLKKPLIESNVPDMYYYELLTSPGFGYCIHTYIGDGNPLPAFKGDPYLLPLSGDIFNIADTIWGSLDEENRISMAVKFIEIKTGKSETYTINKYDQIK